MENFDVKKYDNRIKRYIHKMMDSDEEVAFKNEIISNIELANEVKAQEFEIAFNYLSVKADLKEKLENYKEQERIKTEREIVKINFFKTPRFWAIAASLLIGIISFGTWQYVQNKPSVEGIVKIDTLSKKINLSPTAQEMLSNFIQESQQPNLNVPNPLKQATLEYERGNFKSASKLLEKPRTNTKNVPNNNPDLYGSSPNNNNKSTPKIDPKLESYRALYQGLIFLSNREYDKAISTFNSVGKPMKDEAKWYTSLAYLEKGDSVNGIKLLSEIADNESNSHYADAQTLLESVKKK